jgi:hypothetical protein
MKTRALVIAGVMALVMFATTRVAQAQQSLVVNVPFDFVAANKALPAGEYAVKVSGAGHTLILIDRKDASASALMVTYVVSANEIQTDSKLVFNRYGDRYFLSQVWTAGNSCGSQLIKTDREKETALSAKIETEGQVTLVASLLRNNP